MEYFVYIKDKKYKIEIENGVDIPEEIIINGTKKKINYKTTSSSDIVSLILDDKMHELQFEEDGDNLKVKLNSKEIAIKVETKREQMLRKHSESESTEIGTANIVAPMPGLIVKVLINSGDKVKKGEGVVIVEAMKMENEVRSLKKGMVEEIRVKEGDKVDKGQVLIVIK